ncbi:hypothetical protein GCM10010452_79270 [Crossiella cryophila]
MASQAPSWAAVGSAKAPWNQSLVAGENIGRSAMAPILTPHPDIRPNRLSTGPGAGRSYPQGGGLQVAHQAHRVRE